MSDYSANAHQSSADLARELEAQRQRVSSTLDEIQHRMSPGQLLDGVMDYTGDGSKEFIENLGRSVRDNPLPVALVGAGLLWLMTGSGRPNGHASTAAGRTSRNSDIGAWDGADDDVHGSTANGLLDKARHAGEDLAGGVSEAAGGIADAAGRMTRQVDRTTRNVLGQVRQQAGNLGHLYEEQPLIGGALAFAMGAALGALLPPTQQEDELLGEAADSVKAQAAVAAGDLFEEGRDLVGDGYAEIKEKVAGVLEDPDLSDRPGGLSG
ncbi:DUF3618 domain-containing protein [Devosia sp.]|uniref:DUF3618 domain-containing protein n=1 Tax=Devosia sp. TaxID=1871048 RepID=UPI002F02DC18